MIQVLPAPIPHTERAIVCESVAEQLQSDHYVIEKLIDPSGGDMLPADLGPWLRWPSIVLRPKRFNKDQLDNVAMFVMVFWPDEIRLVMNRATTTRIIATFDYSDPMLFDELAVALARLRVRWRM